MSAGNLLKIRASCTYILRNVAVDSPSQKREPHGRHGFGCWKVDRVDWTWTWSGCSFGYWLDDDLGTYHGKHVGRRSLTHIHAPNGRYLGEVMGNGRLVTNKAKAGLKG